MAGGRALGETLDWNWEEFGQVVLQRDLTQSTTQFIRCTLIFLNPTEEGEMRKRRLDRRVT